MLRKRLKTISFLMLFLLLVTSLISASGWLGRWDQLLYDLQLSQLSSPPSDDIVIVAVDEKSLEALGRWPWSREVHARLVERLTQAGAKAIVLDILFSQPDQDPQADIQLIRAIAASNRVFLPVILEQQRQGGGLVESMPLPALSNVAAGLGHAHMALDADGIARGVYLHEGLGEARWPHLMLSLKHWLSSDQAGAEPLPVLVQTPGMHLVSRRAHRLIPFAGPAGTYPRYAYSQVLEGAFMPDLLRDKIVMVGVTATGMGDALPTPVSAPGTPMPRVEINANIFDSLRAESAIHPVSLLSRLLGSGLLVILPFILYPFFPTRLAPLVSLMVALGFLLIDWVMLKWLHLWFPPSAVLLGLGLGYPLWSWRRMDRALHYLNERLERMQREQRCLTTQPPAGDLADAMVFLSHLMPLKGWVVYDVDGKRLMQGGEPLDGPLELMEQEGWQRSGAELWHSIQRPDRPWRLGLLWPRTQVPQGRSLSLLSEFALQFAEEPHESHGSVLDRVELRMGQMQSANARLQRFRHLINNAVGQMDDGLIVINSLGQVLMSNPQASVYLGHGLDEDLLGQDAIRLLQVLEIRDVYHWQEAFQQVLLEGEAIRFEALRPPDSELLIQLNPLEEADAGMYGMIVNLSDVGDLKRAERTRAMMLDFLSHHIRSPINSMLSLSQSYKLQAGTASELAGQIEPLAKRSLRLADNFLQLVRAEAADAATFADTDFISVAHSAVEEAYGQARKRGITLRREFEAAELWLRGDLELLERALFNLLENAIKFSSQGGEVIIRVRREDGCLVCTVEDQGPGMPEEACATIFLPFTQAETENTSQGKGIGLGLSFVKLVADRHRGTVEASSSERGGAVFTLRLPCEAGAP